MTERKKEFHGIPFVPTEVVVTLPDGFEPEEVVFAAFDGKRVDVTQTGPGEYKIRNPTDEARTITGAAFGHVAGREASPQRADVLRARVDAVRVVYAALAPFEAEGRGRIMRAVHELYEGPGVFDEAIAPRASLEERTVAALERIVLALEDKNDG